MDIEKIDLKKPSGKRRERLLFYLWKMKWDKYIRLITTK